MDYKERADYLNIYLRTLHFNNDPLINDKKLMESMNWAVKICRKEASRQEARKLLNTRVSRV